MKFKGNLIGLTGGIAAGKSVVTKLLREASIPVVDFDVVVKEVRELAEVQVQLMREFGTTDNIQLRDLLFVNNQTAKLENILYPLIKERIHQTTRELFEQHKMVVWDCPLLLEKRLESEYDFSAVVVVHCDSIRRMYRLCRRNPEMSEDTAMGIFANQLTDEERRRRCLDIGWGRTEVYGLLNGSLADLGWINKKVTGLDMFKLDAKKLIERLVETYK
jgi:dephospho-CoA kinase